jgi:hypothetical protein
LAKRGLTKTRSICWNHDRAGWFLNEAEEIT